LKKIKAKKINFKDFNIKKAIKFILKKIKGYLLTNKLFLSYAILSIISCTLLRAFTIGDALSYKPFVVDLSLILIIGSMGYLIKPKKQFVYFATWLIIFTFVNIANGIYYTFYFSFATFGLLSSLGQAGEVTGAVLAKLDITHFIYLIMPVIFFIINGRLKHKKYFEAVTKTEKSKKMMASTLIAGGALLILPWFLSPNGLGALSKQWNREYIVERFGIILYQSNDLVQSLTPKINQLFGYDEAARNFREYYSTKEKVTTNNEYTGVFKDKNIIFIHMESIQNFTLDMEVNGKEITPNLNKLKEESIYFDHFYPQISVGTSSDTEFTLLTSLMPALSGTVFVSYTNTYYETIPKILKEEGYYTFSMHANKASMWNRAVAHESLGYDTFYSQRYFNIPDSTDDPEWIGLGLSDKEFFKQSEAILENIETNYDKYMGTMITLSNHTPWDDTEKYGDFDLTAYVERYNEKTGETELIADTYLEDSKMGNYLKGTHYTDEALGEFVNYVKSSDYFDNTVFIFYGDHEARLSKKEFNNLYNYNIETGELLSEDDPNYYDYDYYLQQLNKNTPLIIWTKDEKYTGAYSYYMGMIDIMPTLANMMGFSYEYGLGNDIFTIKDDNTIVFPNGNFLTSEVYYNNTKEEYKVLKDAIIDEDYINEKKAYTEEILNLSNNIIVHDLIRKEATNLNKVMEENNEE